MKSKILSGLLESHSSSSVEELAKDTAAAAPPTGGDGKTAVSEPKTQSEVPDIVSSTSG